MHPKLLDHFRNPRNAGPLPEPSVWVEAVNPVCGDVLRLWVRIENRVVSQASFQTRGCTASIAASSALTELIQGRSIETLDSLAARDLEDAVGELPAEGGHAAALCLDAIQQLSNKFSVKQ